MTHIRKHYGKWQAIVKRKNIRTQKSFLRKLDASKWAYKVEAQIETGSYLTIKKAERLNEIKLGELLDIFFDKTKSKSKNPVRFEYEVNYLKRFPISNLYLSQLDTKILAEFRDARLEEGKAGSTVNKYLGLISRAINKGRRELDIPVNFNPVSLVEKCEERKEVDRSLDEEEWERLVECASRKEFPQIKDRYGRIFNKRESLYFMKEIIIFARETLMRQGELLIFPLNPVSVLW